MDCFGSFFKNNSLLWPFLLWRWPIVITWSMKDFLFLTQHAYTCCNFKWCTSVHLHHHSHIRNLSQPQRTNAKRHTVCGLFFLHFFHYTTPSDKLITVIKLVKSFLCWTQFLFFLSFICFYCWVVHSGTVIILHLNSSQSINYLTFIYMPIIHSNPLYFRAPLPQQQSKLMCVKLIWPNHQSQLQLEMCLYRGRRKKLNRHKRR